MSACEHCVKKNKNMKSDNDALDPIHFELKAFRGDVIRMSDKITPGERVKLFRHSLEITRMERCFIFLIKESEMIVNYCVIHSFFLCHKQLIPSNERGH